MYVKKQNKCIYVYVYVFLDTDNCCVFLDIDKGVCFVVLIRVCVFGH